MIRATTGGVLRSYRNNLMNSFIKSNKARETVLSRRVFNSYAEDPAAAAKAFRLRKSRLTADSQLDVCEDTYYKYEAAYQSLQTVSRLIDTENGSEQMNTLKQTTLRMLNDPTGDARTQLSKALDQLDETIVQNMNQKYGDDFIFAGADGHNVPFEVVQREDGTNQLLYRGVPVDAEMPETLKDANGDPLKIGDDYVLASATTVEELPVLENDGANMPYTVIEDKQAFYIKQGSASMTEADFQTGVANGTLAADDYMEAFGSDGTKMYFEKDSTEVVKKSDYDEQKALMDNAIKDAGGNPQPVTIDGKTCYIVDDGKGTMSEEDYSAASRDAEKLKYLANEKRFVDIGLGFQENEDGELIESSAFNESLNGLTFLGYGVDADGDPKNIYSIVQRLKEIAESVPDGTDWSAAVYDEFNGLVKKLEKGASSFKTEFTNMAASTTKLENNVTLLKENVYNLKEQYSNIEDVDMADAISSFIWAEYCYNAALKVGNSILSQSLMDYLN